MWFNYGCVQYVLLSYTPRGRFVATLIKRIARVQSHLPREYPFFTQRAIYISIINLKLCM